MAFKLSSLYSMFSIPAYTGPHKVGSIDVEIPVSLLSSPSPAPDSSISTISFRVFYPCQTTPGRSKRINWIPEPQYEHVSAYARFLGVSQKLSNLIAYLPLLMYHFKIPAFRNAPLKHLPTPTHRYPVLVFSHGLMGGRNTYSHLCGSLASHGIVVVACEHRDGSGPISFVSDADGGRPSPLEYRAISHERSPEVLDARDEQLRIRLWELGLVHSALLDMDEGSELRNLSSEATGVSLSMFKDSLDIHRPGSISWAGHSFGAATTYQFVKSVYYRPSQPPCGYKPLYTPVEDSRIVHQITPETTIALLDLWTLPILSDSTAWLREKSLPCYEDKGPGGSNIIAILSEAFFKWQANLVETKRAISEDPSLSRVHAPKRPPHFFYPLASAHLSQSDFGVVFPHLVRIAFKAQDHERILRLNTRAILELLRQNGKDVADTSFRDMEQLQPGPRESDGFEKHIDRGAADVANPIYGLTEQDKEILSRTRGAVRGWIALGVEMDGASDKVENSEIELPPQDAVEKGWTSTEPGLNEQQNEEQVQAL